MQAHYHGYQNFPMSFVRISDFFKGDIMYEIYCKLRDEHGLKDADLVRETGITKSTFSNWKSGRSNPKNEKLQKIASFLV